MEKRRVVAKLILVFVLLVSFSGFAFAQINVVNSQDWRDVYSVMMHSSLENTPCFFLNSKSTTGLVKVIPLDAEVSIYQSDEPYVGSLSSQFSSMDIPVNNQQNSDDFNLELDPETGKYILVSSSNYRLSISLAPYAKKTNSWVYIVDDDNVDEVVDSIEGADVLAVGTFPRSVYEKIEPHIDETINNNNMFKDSEEIAERFGDFDNVVLTDGTMLESEFFTTTTPVIVTGPNKLLDETYNFLDNNNVESVVIVGNQLAVVGEQIRSKSDKKISVFIKFGQSSLKETGKVFGLSMYPLPKPTVALDVTRVIYNPLQKKLICYYSNEGNTGLYGLSTVVVRNGDEELASVEDSEAWFLGADETYPAVYDMELNIDEIDQNTSVEFFTSFGLRPSALDTYLTNTDKYGTPFTIGLEVKEIEEMDLSLDLLDVSYYTNLNRVGVELENTGTRKVYYDIKILQLVVNGVPEDLSKSDSIDPGETKLTYLPVELDKIDIEENQVFDITIVYGNDEENKLQKISEEVEFKTKTGNPITGMVTAIGQGGAGPVVAGVFVLVVIAGVVFFFVRKR